MEQIRNVSSDILTFILAIALFAEMIILPMVLQGIDDYIRGLLTALILIPSIYVALWYCKRRQ